MTNCTVALSQMLLNFESDQISNLNLYSAHWYTDVGYPDACNHNASGSYTQVMIYLPPLPLGFPLSLCLPAVCNEQEFFQPKLSELSTSLTGVVDNIKKTTNLNDLSKNLPDWLFTGPGEDDRQLVTQMTALVGNETTISLVSYVVKDDQATEEGKTEELWTVARLLVLLVFVILCLIPNLVLLARPCTGRGNQDSKRIRPYLEQ